MGAGTGTLMMKMTGLFSPMEVNMIMNLKLPAHNLIMHFATALGVYE